MEGKETPVNSGTDGQLQYSMMIFRIEFRQLQASLEAKPIFMTVKVRHCSSSNPEPKLQRISAEP